MARKVKLLTVGSDSMSFRVAKQLKWPKGAVIQPLMAVGQKVKDGRGGERDAWHTGPNWGGIYTGVTPDKHGITSGGWLTGHDNWLRLKVETVWDELIIRGFSVGMMTMPLTWPAIAGFEWMVSGFPAPDDVKGCFEPTKVGHLMPPGFVVDWLNQDMSRKSWVRGVRDHLLEDEGAQGHLFGVARMKTDYLLDLIEKVSRPEVVAIGYTLLDRAHHTFPSDSEFIRKAYYFQIRLLEELVQKISPQKYLLMSDHGSLPNDLWHDAEGTLVTKGIDVPKGKLVNTIVKRLVLEAL